MSKRFSILLVVLTIVSGLIGGLISGRIFAVNSAQAVETKQSKVLTVEELRIVDSNGKLLMALGENRYEDKKIFDGYGLFIFGKDDKPKATMCVYEVSVDEFGAFGTVSVSDAKQETVIYGGDLTVYDKDDIRHPRITMSADDSVGSVLVSSKDGNVSAGMIVDESDSVISVSKNRDGSPAVAMGTGELGNGVYVYGNDDEVRASMSVGEDMSIIGVSGKNGNRTASMQSLENTGTIGVTGKDNKSGVVMEVNNTGGVVNLFAEDSKPRVSIQVNKSGDGVIKLLDKSGKQLK